jgi:outer membrane protein
MSQRSKLSALAVALMFVVPSLAAATELKVGYVDYQRILLEVEDGKAAKVRLQKWLESRQKEIDSEQEALRKEKETLEKQRSAMSEDAFVQKATDLQKKVYDLAQKWEKSRGEAAEKERKEMEPIVGKIDEVINRLAERDGLDLVFEKRDSGLVYALGKYDMTNEVIRAYNAGSKPRAKDAPTKK